ncbi:MAG: transcription termination factor NusA [Candidatus Dojkabacteria bacterium]|nr:MAG: transcription termination factor NusA [Candidatus Dojkabacteria bacterium]
MALVSEFLAAINQIASERGIDPEEVFQALEAAVAAAYRKEYGGTEESVRVELDRDDGKFKVIANKEVVAKVEDEFTQISLKQAKAIEDSLEIGDSVEIEQEVEDFGRIAAQTAKQVIMQKVRDSEKEAVLAEYSGKVGEVFAAMMQRMQYGDAVFEIGKAMAFMPPEEQISSEFYRIGERYKVLLKDIADTPKGKTLIVSRSAPNFLIELFKMEVPEIESGVVEVKACAREAGSRSKMAVTSHQEGVDPIGSCVGQRGVRIANVMAELGDEKIDIIEWREELSEFVEKALSPAQVISVEINGDLAIVKVEEDQLSLAIGKDGQNVRLAAKLTGMKIDIQGPDGKLERRPKGEVKTDDSAAADDAVADDSATTDGSALDAALVKKLEKAGKTADDVKGWSVEQLMELDGIGKATAEKINKALN